MRRLLLLLLLFPFLTKAQQRRLFSQVDHAISVNPFALAQMDYTLLAGYETKLKDRLFFSSEAGYIFASGYITTIDNPSQEGSGFMLRPSVKWFQKNSKSFYLQPQLFYKQFTHKGYDWIGKNAVNGVPAYEQYQYFRYRREIFGFNAVAGFALPVGRQDKWYFDLYFGLGVRYKKSYVVGEPQSIYREPSGTVFLNGIDNGLFPSLPAGMRVIYAIK